MRKILKIAFGILELKKVKSKYIKIAITKYNGKVSKKLFIY